MCKKLKDLYSTLLQVETKGSSTIFMGDCLKFLNQCILEIESIEKENLDMKKEISDLNKKIAELLDLCDSEKEVE